MRLPQSRPNRRGLAAAAACVVLAGVGAATSPGVGPAGGGQPGPAPLPAGEFRRLVTDLSEPPGVFRADNLVSNEAAYQSVIPALRARWVGGAYLGVGPDQNFTYVAALRPSLAFIVDVRRENLLQHLLFKALFELSASRAAFVARLFGRPVPAAAADASAAALFEAVGASRSADELVDEVERQVIGRLTGHHRVELSADDRVAMRRMLDTFAAHGPALSYSSTSAAADRGMPTFAELQNASDLDGQRHAYLATGGAYATVRAWQMADRIVPVVGDFAGDHALAGIGRYLAARGERIAAFYASNVEEYLFSDGRWRAFYATLGTLPWADQAFLIRSTSGSSRLDPVDGLLADVRDGKIRTYADITGRGGIR